MNPAVKLIGTIALALLCAFAPAQADVPTEMSVQGRLTNASGAPVSAGFKNFTFKIFDLQSGGTEIWPAGPGETQTLVTDANGLWNAGIGQVIPLPEVVFENPVRWLEVSVDDGVNPVETLPRFELRTNPYTFRSAKSQQADSLGGSSLSDLTDQFVDQVGDTMSGQFRIEWHHSGTGGANLEIDNGILYAWSLTMGTWGAALATASDSSLWNIGLASLAQGANTQNFGIQGVSRGENSSNYGVIGQAHSGNKNYAGYFIGDVEVTGAFFGGGDSTVILPADAISSAEILNEPGITSEYNPTNNDISLTSTTTDYVTVTIDIPADGYIHVQGNVYCWTTGGAGDNSVGFFQIDETSGGGLIAPYLRVVGEYGRATAEVAFHPVTVERTFQKSAGTYTFRLEGAEISVSGSGNVLTIWPVLTATYHPTAYGTVAAVVASSDAGEFEYTEVMHVSPDAGGTQGDVIRTEQMLKVDLHELEMKAAKIQAELERTRRELVEAQIGDLSRAGQVPVAGEEPKQ